jgi:uncharacterized protein YdhG (YjbR/CyaY superfamily)
MKASSAKPKTIDEYIAGFPPEVQEILNKVRLTIRKAAPKAEEAIKYDIPTFVLGKNLVHFAAYSKHIGIYPVPSGSDAFNKQLAPYVKGKGTVQFPLDKPIPYGLISKIVKARMKEVQRNAAAGGKKK